MKKLINEWIKTIKKSDTFYTYCELWDKPTKDNFPNERVGVGKTKDESMDKFMAHEKMRQELLNKIKEEIKE